MKKIMKYNFLIALLACFTSITVMAQDHTFSYQGQLLDNGSSANGSYDITISGFPASVGGSVFGQVSTHLAVDVSNGLFNLNNVDIVDVVGIDPFDGFPLWLEVGIRPAGGGAYESLSPRQQVNAVPYADNITRKGASSGQVLAFNGSSWEPQNNTHTTSPWTESGSNVSYDGTVGIGSTTIANVDLFIDSDTGRSPLIARINNDPKFQINTNGGTTIGFLLQTPPVDGLLVEGDVMLNQELNATVSGDADMKAYIYGAVTAAGDIVSDRSSDGFTVSKTSTGKFKIDFTGPSIAFNYIAFAIKDTSQPNFTTTDIFSNTFNVYMYDIAGSPVDDTFSFVVYKK